MEDTAETTVAIINPNKAKKASEKSSGNYKQQEMQEWAAAQAKKTGKPMVVITTGNSMEMRAASKEDIKKQESTRTAFQPPVIESAPESIDVQGKSQGTPWSNHISKHGIQEGPGRHKRKV